MFSAAKHEIGLTEMLEKLWMNMSPSCVATICEPHKFVQLPFCFFRHSCNSDSTVFSGVVSLFIDMNVVIITSPIGMDSANIDKANVRLACLMPCMAPNATPPKAAKEKSRRSPESCQQCAVVLYHNGLLRLLTFRRSRRL